MHVAQKYVQRLCGDDMHKNKTKACRVNLIHATGFEDAAPAKSVQISPPVTPQ
jgi:hypothetical protein